MSALLGIAIELVVLAISLLIALLDWTVRLTVILFGVLAAAVSSTGRK